MVASRGAASSAGVAASRDAAASKGVAAKLQLLCA